MSRRRRGLGTDDVVSLVVGLMIAMIAMPITGLFFLLRKNPSKRWLGWILLILGVILWIVVLATI